MKVLVNAQYLQAPQLVSICFVQKGHRTVLTSPQQAQHQMEVLELSLAEKTAECSRLKGSPLFREH